MKMFKKCRLYNHTEGEFLQVSFVSLLSIGAKKEKAAFETLKRHAAVVVNSVKKFREAMEAFSERKFEEAEKLAQEVDQLESKADGIRVKFESELGAGAFLPVFRGDLARLSERLDDVADMAEEAILGIKLRPKLFDILARAEKKDKKAEGIRIGLVELAGKAVETAQALKESIGVFLEDMDMAVKKTVEVDRFERESDILEEKILKDLYRYEKLLCPITVMQVKSTIEQIGDISNNAEDAGDILSAMCYSLKA